MSGTNIVELIQSAEPHFQEIAKRDNLLTWKAEARFALQAVEKNTALQTCTPETIRGAIINVAACGLTLNPADGYAYLVPEYNKDTGNKECQLRISYKGMIKGATDTGAISWVKAEVVKEGEEFEYNGISEPPVHRIKEPFSRNKKQTIGAYVVAQTPTGAYLVDMIDADELTKIQQCAKTQAVWSKWPDEMAKKAIIKRAAKQWPKVEDSSRFHQMIDVVNNYEGGFEEPKKELIGTDDIDVDKVNKAEIRYRELLDADIEEEDRAKAIQAIHFDLSPDEQIEVHNRFGQEKLEHNPRKNKRSAIKEYTMMRIEEVA
jgi:recombination protein RecT